jgi:hypothetical protein
MAQWIVRETSDLMVPGSNRTIATFCFGRQIRRDSKNPRSIPGWGIFLDHFEEGFRRPFQNNESSWQQYEGE